ncbi:MAG: PAS domain S-box protein [Candidatus Methanoperedens sp.]|nr:PAS domain S-box protein [Candidatus Methanoperedens sp.]
MSKKILKLSIGNKILLGFSIFIGIYLGMTLISYQEMEEISILADRAVPLNSQINSLQEFSISMETLERDLDRYFVINDEDSQDKANKDFQKMNLIIESLKKNSSNNNSINSFQDMKMILNEINMNFNNIVALKNNPANSREINERRIIIYQLIDKNRKKNSELLLKTTNDKEDNFHEQQRLIYESIKIFLILNVFILMLGIFLSYFTLRSISRPIDKLKDATNEIGKGRLNVNIPIQSNDEVGQLASALNKMAKELQKTTVSNEYVENIIRSMFDSLVVATTDGNIKTVNKAVCELLGYGSEELVGQPVDKLFSHENTQSSSPWLDELFKKGIINLEETCLAKDGRKIPVLLSISSMRGNEGNILGIVYVAKDITDRKQMEDTLRRKEELFRSFIENALDTITILNRDGTIGYQSPSVERVLGYKAEELIGKIAFEFIHPEDLHRSMSSFNQVIGNPGSAQSIEFRFKHKDGSWRVLEAVGKTMDDKAGLINTNVQVIINSRDITDRKHMEEALQISEKKYSTLVEKGNDGIVIIQNGFLEFINSKMSEIAGYPIKEVIGKSFINFVSAEFKEVVINNYKKRLAGEEIPNRYEIAIISKEGKNIPVEINASLIDYKGKRAEMAIIRDITDRKHAEEALRESEEKYRVLMNDASDAIILVDTRENIVDANKKAEQLTGYNKNELLTMKIFQLHPEEERERIRVSFKEGIQKEPAVLNDLPILRKDGKMVPVDITGNNVVFAGKQMGLVVFRDITERKLAEDKIKTSLQEKETLLKEIHHRVKNNLQIVSSLLDHQTQYIKDKNVIDIFTESQNRISSMSLIHEKLYRSKDLAKIDFNDYINDLVANLFQSYNSNSGNMKLNMNIQNVRLDIDFAIPCGLIINELVTNSLKYAFPEGRKGEIKIAFFETGENMLELVIGDNGIGISKDLDFRKTESLGLHLVTILAENQLHGEIYLNRNHGTEFHIKFNNKH